MARLMITALVLALTGCVTYSGGGGNAETVGSYFNYATKSGRLAVMVLGDPLPGSRAKIERLMIGALDANFSSLKTTFVATPVMAPAADKKLFAFDTAFTTFDSELCRAPAQAKSSHQGPKMRVGVIFCSDRAVSRVWAGLDWIASVDDPRLAEVIDGLAFRLVPRGQRTTY
jgi:hypothetical protein